MVGRKVVDARNAADGTISHVKIEGNSRFTRVEKAMDMAERGLLTNAHRVDRAGAKPFLRTNPNERERDNLDFLASK